MELDPVLADRYRHVRWIGKGSYGTVHVVRDARAASGAVPALTRGAVAQVADRHTEKEWCLKVVKTAVGDLRKSAELSSALREVRLMEGMSHPNIVALREALHSSDGAYIYIIMAYCDSGDLEGRIADARRQGRPIPEDQIMVRPGSLRAPREGPLAKPDPLHRIVCPGLVHSDGAGPELPPRPTHPPP